MYTKDRDSAGTDKKSDELGDDELDEFYCITTSRVFVTAKENATSSLLSTCYLPGGTALKQGPRVTCQRI